MCTDNVIFRDKSHVMYKLYSGIKQGLPLSPLLFLFYINDIFDFFGSIYDGGRHIFDVLHLLIHADDATIIASSRVNAINKLRSMLSYCNLNYVIPQFSKCEFVGVNGTDDDREPLPFGNYMLQNVEYITLLGSHLTSGVLLAEEISLHMQRRYKSVIKFYNFIRSNKSAPLKVKIKVLKSCVMSSLLYNCETFGNCVPKDLESTYLKLLKCCFNVRTNVPNYILYAESGFLPIKSIIHSRKLKFYKRFRESIETNSRREKMFTALLAKKTNFIQHYEHLLSKYSSGEEILVESRSILKQKNYDFDDAGRYKYSIYAELNPDLSPSPFLDIIHPISTDIIKFRVGSHCLPIETGRWNRTPRHEILCTSCGELGDKKHVIYSCLRIPRDDIVLDDRISHIWYQPEIFKLFKRIKTAKYL